MNKIKIASMNIRPYVVYHRVPYQTLEYDQMIKWCELTFGNDPRSWTVNNIHGVSFASRDDAKIFELVWRIK